MVSQSGSITPIWMTIRTAPGNIQDVLFFMVSLRFGLIMTGITGPCRGPTGMTFGTITIGVFVIDWETVVEIGRTPATGIVALRALTGEVVTRAGVAGLAIGCSGSLMVEAGRAPATGIVTLRALS